MQSVKATLDSPLLYFQRLLTDNGYKKSVDEFFSTRLNYDNTINENIEAKSFDGFYIDKGTNPTWVTCTYIDYIEKIIKFKFDEALAAIKRSIYSDSKSDKDIENYLKLTVRQIQAMINDESKKEIINEIPIIMEAFEKIIERINKIFLPSNCKPFELTGILPSDESTSNFDDSYPLNNPIKLKPKYRIGFIKRIRTIALQNQIIDDTEESKSAFLKAFTTGITSEQTKVKFICQNKFFIDFFESLESVLETDNIAKMIGDSKVFLTKQNKLLTASNYAKTKSKYYDKNTSSEIKEAIEILIEKH